MARRIVVLDDYQQVAHSYADWASVSEEVDFVQPHLVGEELVERIGEADVVVAMRERTPLDSALLDRLPSLRLLVTTGAANASIDVAEAHQRGVTVCGTGGVTRSAGELTWALILAVVRHIPTADAASGGASWQDDVPPGRDLAGATLGVIGLGKLGARVARVGQAFGMRALAWSQNLDPEHARSLDVEPVDKQTLLRTADVVSLHLKLSDRTRGIVGADDLAVMKPTAVLINTSRGPLVDEDALVAALTERRIAGAGLDVFDIEPLPLDHPLRRVPNTVLAPHVGYVTEETYDVFFTDVVEDIAAFEAGAPVRVIT